MRIALVIGLGAVLGFPMAAAAQNTDPIIQATADLAQPRAECLCVLPAEVRARIAAVQDVEGQVLLSDARGYTPIQSHADLSVGDRVVLLNDGRATLTGPACQVALAPDSTITLVPTDTGICVAQALTAPGTAPGGLAGRAPLTGAQIPGLIVAGGLVGVGGAGAIVGAIRAGGGAGTPVSP